MAERAADRAAFLDRKMVETSATFGVSVRLLEPELRTWVSTAYLFARTFDTIEDATGVGTRERVDLLRGATAVWRPGPERVAWLRRVEGALPATALLDWEHGLLRELPELVTTYDGLPADVRRLSEGPLTAMAHGMGDAVAAADSQRPDTGFRSVGELLHYCFCVAGVVGHLLSDLFCHRINPADLALRAALHRHAAGFGAAMQISNILKNVGDDLERGAAFLAPELLPAGAGSLAEVARAPRSRGARQLVLNIVELLSPFLEEAKEYTLAIPARTTGGGTPGEAAARSVREFLSVQLMLVTHTVRRAINEPELAFRERLLQARGTVVADLLKQARTALAAPESARNFLSAEIGRVKAPV